MEQFCGIFEKEMGRGEDSLLLRRLFAIFECGNAKSSPAFLTFKRYSLIMSVIKRGEPLTHLKLAFELYDLDNDGLISSHDIFHLLRCDPTLKLDKDFSRLLQGKYENRCIHQYPLYGKLIS